MDLLAASAAIICSNLCAGLVRTEKINFQCGTTESSKTSSTLKLSTTNVATAALTLISL